MSNGPVTLVGDGIENPGNALAMIHAAQMCGAGCGFRDTKGIAQSEEVVDMLCGTFPTITSSEIKALHSRVIAFDNLPGASSVYGFRAGSNFAVLVGNERRGLSHEFCELATDAVEIPMQSRRINCLNVAAASAVALYYLCRGQAGQMAVRRDPANRRPELLLLGAGDHIELGCAIRSAAALGWARAFVEDRDQVWFGCDRVIRSEGRAAARRARNDIRLIPGSADATYAFPEVTVITTTRLGVPIHRANLARGPRQLVVVPDESRVKVADETWARLGQEVLFAHLDLPDINFTYRYRLVATVALAEISRQVGGRLPGIRGPRFGPPIYDRALERLAEAAGEVVSLSDLMEY